MMKVLNYIYVAPEKRTVFAGNVDNFLDDGWKVIKYDSVEQLYLIGKSAYVIVEAINDDFNLEVLELRDIIVAACGSKNLTRLAAKRFFEEIETGKRELTKEKGAIRSYKL